MSNTPFRLSWLRSLLTLLEASVIHFLVFIVYCRLCRTDNNGSISNSVVDSYHISPFPSLPTFTTPHSLTLECTHHQTQYPPPCQMFAQSHPFLAPLPSLPSVFNQLYIYPHVSCISDYAPSHSHLIFTTVISLLFFRILGGPFRSPSHPLVGSVVGGNMLCSRNAMSLCKVYNRAPGEDYRMVLYDRGNDPSLPMVLGRSGSVGT